jgi:HlyD family secretion protein
MKANILKIFSLTFTCGVLLAACDFYNNTLHGYVEGQLTYLSSPSDGKLIDLKVSRGQSVKQGQFLFSLDPYPQVAELKSAKDIMKQATSVLKNLEVGKRPTEIEAIESKIKQVKARVAFLSRDNERYKLLIEKSAVERQRYDQSTQDLKVAINQLKELEADLETAKLPAREHEVKAAEANLASTEALQEKASWELQEKSSYAPKDATVFDTYFKVGERVPSSRPVLSLLVPQDIIAVFFIPETQLSTTHINQHISIYCDSCKKPYKGRIRFISPQAEYTPPVIYSNTARSKLVFRVEAQILSTQERALNPGQPIDIILEGNKQ